jgi:transposase
MLKNCDPEAIKKGPNDVRRFLKNTSKSKSEYILDTEKIKEEEKFDGFYAIATNLDDPVKDILEIAHKRYQIEDCFRIMKTNFDARPVHHRNTPRIEAHFLICYTALLITRLLQRKLDDQGTHLTTDQLINTMKNMIVVNEEDIYYRAIYSNSKALEALEKYAGYQFDSQYLMKSDFTKILRKIKRRPSYTTLKS